MVTRTASISGTSWRREMRHILIASQRNNVCAETCVRPKYIPVGSRMYAFHWLCKCTWLCRPYVIVICGTRSSRTWWDSQPTLTNMWRTRSLQRTRISSPNEETQICSKSSVECGSAACYHQGCTTYILNKSCGVCWNNNMTELQSETVRDTNLRFADDTTLLCTSKEELLFMRSNGSKEPASPKTHCLTLKRQRSYVSRPLVPFIRGEVLPTTSSPPHRIVFFTLLCLLSSFSSLPPLLPSSHLSLSLSLGG